ncbi:MAG: monovalent cation/H+ antiporter complex subunit F [Terriglobales bacterium]
MNVWLLAAAVLLFTLVPCGIAAFRGTPVERLVGLEMADIMVCLLLILLAQGMNRPGLYDLALALSLLAFGGGLVFARFLERWL